MATPRVADMKAASMSRCPMHSKMATQQAAAYWPNKLELAPLGKGVQPQSIASSSYALDFLTLDLSEVKADLVKLMRTSQSWWPSDYGHYGPFFIRMAWHSAGTYRVHDGRGGAGRGNLRFAPLNSWPDNANLDKARRLLWPVKKKYGRRLSWADLMVYAGNVALEDMGFTTFGYGGGRQDQWEPEEDVYWGSEKAWLAAERGGLGDDLDRPLAAVQLGLIYVNPEGPRGVPDALKAAADIRTTFRRMAMNDEETVALIAGGHTFGKGHGAANPGPYVGPEPEAANIEEQGLGWANSYGSGHGKDTITSGLEGAWTSYPTKWDNEYFDNLFGYEWELTQSPAGAKLWIPKAGATSDTVPKTIMYTTDLALRFDPAYGPISKRFHENPKEFADAFARAWYKLTHRDLGPVTNLLGPLVPEAQIWQDPTPPVSHPLVSEGEIAALKQRIIASSGLSVPALVKASWASASSYRGTDRRGGSNGGRVALAPQKDWACNDPAELAAVVSALEAVRLDFNAKAENGVAISLADIIVLGGCAAVEESARKAGHLDVVCPFVPGRTDALLSQTDVESFDVLKPSADGFRNYEGEVHEQYRGMTAEQLLVEKARMLTLTKSEMTVLVGGMRVIGANTLSQGAVGVLTTSVGKLTNDFFVNLLDMGVKWSPTGDGLFDGKLRETGEIKWRASRVDLIFGSNSELRALAEYYACDDGHKAFVSDFVAAYAKVMELGR